MRLLGTAVLVAALAAQAPASASACPATSCPAETPTLVAVGVGAALLFVDLRWAARGTRPGRAGGAMELRVGVLQGLLA